jgi:CRISPR system Cascade subunit CasD
MSELLVFRLFGPLASWGEVAVGEIRPSAVRPTRSALLGLLAAARGIRRSDDEAHAALSAGFAFAVRIDLPGVPLVDYHTVNWRRPKRETVLTRGDELRAPRDELHTVQSWRHYRCDALATVAVESRTAASCSLEELCAALERPVFPLSLGRKACVIALPLGPEIVAADTLAGAFRQYDRRRPLPAKLAYRTKAARSVEIAWDEDLRVPSGTDPVGARLVERRDQPLSRRRWRFASRREHVSHVDLRLSHTEEGSHVPQSSVSG